MIKYLSHIKKHKLYSNALFLTINSLILSGLGFLFWTINARLYNSNDLGLALTIISVMSLITVISLFGFDDAIIRFLQKSETKQDKINSVFTSVVISTLIITLIFLLLIDLFSPRISFIKHNPLFLFLFILSTLTWTLFMLIESIFVSYRETKFIVIKNSIFSISKLVLPFFLVTLGSFGIFSSWTLSALIGFLFIIIFIPKEIRSKFKPSIKLITLKEMFRFSIANYILKLLLNSPILLLPIIITHVINAETTAFFYISWMISELLLIIPNSFSTSLFAEASYEEQTLKEKLIKSIKLSYFFVILGIIFIFLFGRHILMLFGQDYITNSLTLLKILAISAIPFTINTIFITVSKIHKNIKELLLIGILNFVLYLSFSLILLPNFNLLGVGFAWLITEVIISIYAIIKLKKYFKSNEYGTK